MNQKLNILSITGILPIPGHIKINDFLLPLYETIINKYPGSTVTMLRPFKISPFNPKVNAIHSLGSYQLNNFPVTIIKYLSAQRFRNLHALLAYTLFYFNRKTIKKIIHERKINIIQAEYILPDGILAYMIKKKYNIPYLIRSHQELRYFPRVISKKICLKAIKNSYITTPLNYYTQKQYIKTGIRNSQVVPLGIDDSFLKYKHEKKQEGIVKIISVAGLIKLKNIDKILIALSQLKDKYDFIYTVAGEGTEKDNLKQLANELGLNNKVNFLGKVSYDKIANLMSSHDIFVLPSYFESFGRVFVEAMAVGLPIICAKDTGIDEYFEQMKEGVSVKHTDIQELTYAIEMLVSNKSLRDKMSLNARKLATKFSWDEIAQKFHVFYQKALNKSVKSE